MQRLHHARGGPSAQIRAALLVATAVVTLAATAAAADAAPSVQRSASRLTARSDAMVSPPAAKPLAGKIIGIDPGHNGRNWTDPAFLNHRIWNGREWEGCDTTGTQTAGGYTEARFNFNVAMYLAADLRKDGARIVLTRKNNHGLGPCVNKRAYLLDRAHASVSIDIHADYGPPPGRGFTVLEPVADGPNDKVIKSSVRFGQDVHLAFLRHTPMKVSNYYGRDGYIFRNDLAGLNLTTMPKVLIECGNMNNTADARLLTTARVQQAIARALVAAIVRFLSGH
jgi:N-acetylmuramoyl-L-alanine amidase